MFYVGVRKTFKIEFLFIYIVSKPLKVLDYKLKELLFWSSASSAIRLLGSSWFRSCTVGGSAI